MILYHGSANGSYEYIKANSKSHQTGKNVAYFTASKAYALICCRLPEENFVTAGVREDGKLHYIERFPKQLEIIYKNKKGYLYKTEDVSQFNNTRGFTYESENDIHYDEIEIINDVYEQILQEIDKGNLIFHSYESVSKEEQEMMAEHIREVAMKDPQKAIMFPFFQLHFCKND